MSDDRSRNRRRRGQWSLVGTLVALAVVAIISAWYYAKILKPQAGSHNGAPAAEQKAYGAACGLYVSQLNQASLLYKQDHNDRPPRSFDDLKRAGGVTDDMLHADGCQFQLDTTTGAVSDIGHGEAAKNAPLVVVGGAMPSGSSPAAPNNSQRGPGGITLPPTGGGSLPANSGGGDDSQ
jgi:hypothetical protein